MLVEMRDVLKVTTQPIECLGNDDVKCAIPGILEELLVSRTQVRGAAHLPIVVGGLVAPALARDALPADSDLVLDGGRVLQIG
jgi:hypothetical protein